MCKYSKPMVCYKEPHVSLKMVPMLHLMCRIQCCFFVFPWEDGASPTSEARDEDLTVSFKPPSLLPPEVDLGPFELMTLYEIPVVSTIILCLLP